MAFAYPEQIREQLEEIQYPIDQNFGLLSSTHFKGVKKVQFKNRKLGAESAYSKRHIEQLREQLEEICYPLDDKLRYIFRPFTERAVKETSTSRSAFAVPASKSEVLPLTPPLTPGLPSEFKYDFHVHSDPKLQHWTRTLIVHLEHPCNNSSMAQAQARYIDRAALRSLQKRGSKSRENSRQTPFVFSKSLEQLNDGNSDGLALATQLFNHDGNLLKKHGLHPWGSELNKGAILILSYLLVQKEYRRQRLAGKAIEALVKKAKGSKGGVEFVFVKPGTIKEDLDLEGKNEREAEEAERMARGRAVLFYQSFGFRRIGCSKWLCLALDRNHASWRTPVQGMTEDPDEGS